MTKELEYVWVKKVLNPTELKEYAQFEQSLKTRFTPEEEEAYGQQWENLVKEVQSNLDKDPASDFGLAMGKRCMDWVNAVCPQKYAALRETLWEKGFKGGHTDVPCDVVAWLDKAVDAYYRGRLYAILSQVEIQPSDTVLKLWNELLEDMYGNAQTLREDLYETIQKDDKISPTAKNWLKKMHAS